MESLLTQKVEKLFLLAFSIRFGATELAAAREAFMQLEVPRKRVRFERLIGQGQSGEVHLATLALPTLRGKTASKGSVSVPVAVKMLRGDKGGAMVGNMAGEEALQLEARLLHQLQHAHIVQVLATVTTSLPTMVCLEYMQNGDLKTYLRFCRPTFFVNLFLLLLQLRLLMDC